MIPDEPEAAQPAESRFSGLIASRWAAALVLVGISAASLWIALNPEWIARFAQWGYVGAFFISLIASASIILPIPGLPLAMAMGTALNPILLGIVTGVGSAIGELSGYAAGASGRILVSDDHESHYRRFERWTNKYGAAAIFLVAVMPIPLFDLAGIAAGASGMPFWQFFLATALGKTVKYIVAILLAAGAFRGLVGWWQ